MRAILVLILSIFLLFGFKDIKSTSIEVYYIVTNPGEDMSSSVRVNWHANLNGTYLEYTTIDDQEFKNKKTIYPAERVFSKPINEDGFISDGFKERIICTAIIDNLTPNTKYMYRVGKDTLSKNYYFKTSEEGAFTFLHITDPQYANDAGAEVFNSLMTEAFKKEEIAFTFFTGDVVDRGGFEEQWSLFFSRSNIPNGIVATGVGNHEYYDASDTPKTFDASYYNAFHNNPKNGAEDVLNSSYYFYYNDVLFIMLDTESKSIINQKQWFSQVLENNLDAKFVIVGMHKSLYGSIYASHSIAVRANWQPLFDKYGVDLVLSGHDHIYARSHNIYQDKVYEDLSKGTTYIIGGSGGKKFYDAKNNPKYAKVIERTSVANLITIHNNSISIELIDEKGETLDTHTINKKRISDVDKSFNKEKFIKSIHYETYEDDKTQLKWDNNYYGNVEKISLHLRNNDKILSEIYFFNDSFIEMEIPRVRFDQISYYTINVYFVDGTTESIDFMITHIGTVLDMIKIKITNVIQGIIYK